MCGCVAVWTYNTPGGVGRGRGGNVCASDALACVLNCVAAFVCVSGRNTQNMPVLGSLTSSQRQMGVLKAYTSAGVVRQSQQRARCFLSSCFQSISIRCIRFHKRLVYTCVQVSCGDFRRYTIMTACHPKLLYKGRSPLLYCPLLYCHLAKWGLLNCPATVLPTLVLPSIVLPFCKLGPAGLLSVVLLECIIMSIEPMYCGVLSYIDRHH